MRQLSQVTSIWVEQGAKSENSCCRFFISPSNQRFASSPAAIQSSAACGAMSSLDSKSTL